MLNIGGLCFKLAMMAWLVYLAVYLSLQICSSYFKVAPFSLMLNKHLWIQFYIFYLFSTHPYF